MAVISQIKVGSTTYDLKATWDNIANKPINLKAYSGSLSTGGWAQLNGKANSPSIAIAYNSAAASWNSATYSASLVFGCSDTRGLLDLAYNTPTVTFGGTSFGGATDDNPKWYFKLNGTSAQSYTLPTASKTLAASDGSNASGTWGISISGNSATTNLLKPIASTTTASASTWNIPSGSKQVWGERFSDSTLTYTPSGGSATTITDTGDWTMWLTPNATSNAATLNMRIDGTYYGSFSGNLSGNASTATSANNLLQNTRLDYGWSGINYFNISAANQSAAKVNDTPFSSATWTHILRFNHANSTGYYTDLAVPFNANGIYYKRIGGGSLQNSSNNGGWVRVFDNTMITSGTGNPSGGSNGDIYIQYS